MSARNEAELRADYANRGAKAAQTREEAMTLARELRKGEAYRDPKHPDHAIVTRDIRQLYQTHIPNQPEHTLLNVGSRLVMAGGADPQLSNAPGTPPARLISRYNSGEPLTAFSPIDRVQLRRMLVSQPEYRDGSHPQHATFVEDAKRLYALDAPGGGE